MDVLMGYIMKHNNMILIMCCDNRKLMIYLLIWSCVLVSVLSLCYITMTKYLVW